MLNKSNYSWNKDRDKPTKPDPTIWSPGWHHCALPASLDLYDGCAYGCSYCFMKQAKRNWHNESPKPLSIKTIKRLLTREGLPEDKGQWQKFNWAFNNIPYMISTRTDPFPPGDNQHTYEVLRLFEGKKVLIVTKNPQAITDRFLDLGIDLAVRVSLSAPDNRLEPDTPPVQERLNAIDKLTQKGVKCSVALLPTKSEYWDDSSLDSLLNHDLYCITMDYYYKPFTSKKLDIDFEKERDFVYNLIDKASDNGIGYHIASVDWTEESIDLKANGLLSCAPDSWPKWKGMIFNEKPEIPKEALIYPLHSGERQYHHMNLLLHEYDQWKEYLGLPIEWDEYGVNRYENDKDRPINKYEN